MIFNITFNLSKGNHKKALIFLQIDFDFESSLLELGLRMTRLQKLVLPGLKQVDIEDDVIEEFITLLSENCKQLQVD